MREDKTLQYTVKCGNMTAVCNSLGAELVSLSDDRGKEYIWCGNPGVWARHAPVLFPVVARTINDTVHINGKAYNMGIHGNAYTFLTNLYFESS